MAGRTIIYMRIDQYRVEKAIRITFSQSPRDLLKDAMEKAIFLKSLRGPTVVGEMTRGRNVDAPGKEIFLYRNCSLESILNYAKDFGFYSS
jgi:hypothetical protein